MRAKAPFRLLYNNDTTNTAGVVSPWHEDGRPFEESLLVASIEEVAGRGVDAYMLSPGMGWVPWWQSKVDPVFFAWWKERTGLEVTGTRGYEKYVYEGGDMVRVLADTCRRHGMAPFVSLRLNDVHCQEHYESKDQLSLVCCRLYVEHPEWHIDRHHASKTGYYSQRGMDWAVPEVRAYKLALLAELAEKYDLAGLELDFLRDNTLFRPETTDEATRVEIITGFVAQVRAALDRAKPGRYLSVRIPLDLKAHGAIGLDVRRLREAGVDMFNLSGWYHTTQRSSIADVRKLADDAAIYLEMTHSTGWHPYFQPAVAYGTMGDPRTSDHQFYTTALLAHRRGADGLSLFNFIYYRMGHQADVPVTEPPFHVLPRLNDLPFLARQSQYYMLSHTYYLRQLPREIAAGQAKTFELDMTRRAPDPAGDATPDEIATALKGGPSENGGRLRLHCDRALAAEDEIVVRFNDAALEPCADASRFFGNPFDPMISPAGHRRAWRLPPELVREGRNTVQVELAQGKSFKLVYLDIGIP